MEIYNEMLFSSRYPHSLSPSIAAGNTGTVYTFWRGIFLEVAVYFSRWGVSWSQPEKILSSELLLPYRIAVDHEGNINLSWCDAPTGSTDQDSQMYFRRFIDRGDTPGEIINLYPGGEMKQKHSRAIVVDSAGNINILFTASTPVNPVVLLFGRSTDNGETWSPPVEIPFHFAMEEFKMVVDDAGNIYIAIFYYGMDAADIYFSRG